MGYKTTQQLAIETFQKLYNLGEDHPLTEEMGRIARILADSSLGFDPETNSWVSGEFGEIEKIQLTPIEISNSQSDREFENRMHIQLCDQKLNVLTVLERVGHMEIREVLRGFRQFCKVIRDRRDWLKDTEEE